MSGDRETLDNNRLEKVLCLLRAQEAKLIEEFTITDIGKEYETYFFKNGGKWADMSLESLNNSIYICNDTFEKNRQMIKINNMIRENNILTKNFNELNEQLEKGLQDLKIFSEKLVDLKNQQCVLKDSINKDSVHGKHIYEVSEMFKDLWPKKFGQI